MSDKWDEIFGEDYEKARAECRWRLLKETKADMNWAMSAARALVDAKRWETTDEVIGVARMCLEQLRINKLGM